MANNVQDILETLQSALTVLQDSRSIDRSAKRRAVQNLHDNGLNRLKDPIVAREFLQKTLTLLFNTIAHDCVEKCREQCLEFVYKAFLPVKDTSFALLEVVDLCKKRVTLSGKVREPAEESEEIRLGVLRLLNLILSRCTAPTIKPTIADDILSIVQCCINDKFPDVQKEACAILLTLTEKKSTYVGYFGDKVTKVVVPVLRHKHAALRVLGIKVVECLVLTSTVGLKPLVEVADGYDKSIMETLAYDNSPAVRETLARCNSTWLTSCSPLDRYQFSDVLLPLLLTASVDDITTVAQIGQKGLHDLNRTCINDMVEAGILPDANDEREPGTNDLGITNLVHHTFKKSLQSIAHVLCISFNQQRLLSLKAMKLLVSFAPDEDLIMELRTIVTILATVQAIENGSRDTQNEIVASIDVVAMKITNPSFYLDVLLPLTTNSSNTESSIRPPIALWLLSTFIQHSPPGAIHLPLLSKILSHVKGSNFTKVLLQDSTSVIDACDIFNYSMRNYVGTTHEKLSEENNYKVFIAGIQLLAICSMAADNLEQEPMKSHQVSSGRLSNAQKLITDTIGGIHQPAQPVDMVIAHYLSTLIESLGKYRGNEPERWNDETLHLRILEVVLTQIDLQDLVDRGVTEKIVNLLVSVGSLVKTGASGREIDSGRIGARIRCIQLFVRLYNMDKDTQHLLPYSEYILKDLILACIELSEPHVGACTLGIQHKLRQQTIICLTTAMDNNSINLTTDSQVAVQSMLLDNLQNHDEHIRQLSVAAMAAFLNRYLTEPESEREIICIKTLLARANDEKKTVILALYTHLPSLAGVLSSQGLQMTREAVISQCEFFTTQRDIQLLAAFRKTVHAIYSLDPTRFEEVVRRLDDNNRKPMTYEAMLQRLS